MNKNRMIYDFMRLVLLLMLGIQEKHSYIRLIHINEFEHKWGSRTLESEEDA